MVTLTTDQLGTRVTTGLRMCAIVVVLGTAVSMISLFAAGEPPAALGVGLGGAVICLLLYALVVIIETLLDIAAAVSPEED